MKKSKSKEKGISAVEFALIFPIIFLMLYGLLTYSLVFAAQHALSLAAAEGARAAVRFSSTSDTFEVRKNAACQMAMESLVWLTSIKGAASCNGGADINIQVIGRNQPCAATAAPLQSSLHCVEVYAQYSYRRNPIIPVLPAILPVPQNLQGKSVTQIALRS